MIAPPTREAGDAFDLGSNVCTPAVTPTRSSGAVLPPLPSIVIKSYDSDELAATLVPHKALPNPSSVSANEQTSPSEDDSPSDEADARFLPAPTHGNDDIGVVLGSLSSMRINSRPPTPDSSAPARLFRTSSKLWKQFRERDEEEDEDDISETSGPTFPESFAKSIRAVQRAQALLDKRTTELEKEIAILRAEFTSSVDTSKALLMKTKESILKERRSIEKTNETAADGLLSLEQKLARAQTSIATLQAKHSAEKEAMESMANDIAEVLAIQEDMGCRLIRLSESQQGIYDTAGRTRDLLTELPHNALATPPSCDEPTVACAHAVDILDERPHDTPSLTLAEEIAASRLCTPFASSTCADEINAGCAICPRSAASLQEHDTLQPSLFSVTIAASSHDPISPTRLHAIYMTSLSDMRLRTVANVRQWIDDVKAKPAVQRLQEQLATYTLDAHTPYGLVVIPVIFAVFVVLPTIMMWRMRAVALPGPEPVHVSDHPIWDSL